MFTKLAVCQFLITKPPTLMLIVLCRILESMYLLLQRWMNLDLILFLSYPVLRFLLWYPAVFLLASSGSSRPCVWLKASAKLYPPNWWKFLAGWLILTNIIYQPFLTVWYALFQLISLLRNTDRYSSNWGSCQNCFFPVLKWVLLLRKEFAPWGTVFPFRVNPFYKGI